MKVLYLTDVIPKINILHLKTITVKIKDINVLLKYILCENFKFLELLLSKLRVIYLVSILVNTHDFLRYFDNFFFLTH